MPTTKKPATKKPTAPRRRRQPTADDRIAARTFSPTHTPDWRWQLALDLHYYQDQSVSKCRDRYLVDAFELQGHLTAEKEIDAVVEKCPALYTVYEWRRERPEITLEIEARILARQTTQEIANLMGLDATLVETYEHLFFDVRAKLPHSDYVFTKIIGLKSSLTPPEEHLRSLIKVMAYKGGPLVLDAALAAVRDGLDEARLSIPPDLSTDHGRNLHAAKKLILLSLLPDRFSDPQLVRYLTSLRAPLTSHKGRSARRTKTLSGKLGKASPNEYRYEIRYLPPSETNAGDLPTEPADRETVDFFQVIEGGD